jgi:C4-dicarboxylate-specific signal transduction histidine kinase
MLQHARTGTGRKESTDINQLANEHLRLSYQKFRAKDKAFHANIETSFDSGVGAASVVPQELGTVLANLFDNAFYAVSEKKRQLNGTFEPTVLITTKREGERVIITVKDNGAGMSRNVAEKVFQPFFTTKPTGEGVGLGLSLSYDVITKGHGGAIKVETKEDEGSLFTIQLPLN